MKNLKLTLLTALIISPLATAFADELPSCNSPEVRLSLEKVPCKEDLRLPGEFDIPELKLDLEDLEDIFNGAESSGGHVVGPAHNTRIQAQRFPIDVQIICSAKLLLDGKKSVSYLLRTQNIFINPLQTKVVLNEDSWEYNLIRGNDIHSNELISVPMAPSTKIPTYEVSIEQVGDSKKKVKLKLCEKRSKFHGGIEKTCVDQVKSTKRASYLLQLTSTQQKPGSDLEINKTMRLYCLKR